MSTDACNVELAEAAAALSVEDYAYLEEHGMMEPPDSPSEGSPQPAAAEAEPVHHESAGNPRRRRRTVWHDDKRVSQS